MGSRPCQAAVITPPGTAAIGGILLCGEGARDILQATFRTKSPCEVRFEPGRIFVGQIADGGETIDQVVIGCEGPDRFAIHCHGNPLLVESLMELFARRGAELISADALLRSKAVSEETTTIVAEAKVERLKAVTMEGFCLISNQIAGGLSRWATDALDRGDAISIPDIQEECKQILADSRIARRIVSGCRAAIVGPPNSGKSTLFNRLCGASKSIVADIGGTTRDWVSAVWRNRPRGRRADRRARWFPPARPLYPSGNRRPISYPCDQQIRPSSIAQCQPTSIYLYRTNQPFRSNRQGHRRTDCCSPPCLRCRRIRPFPPGLLHGPPDPTYFADDRNYEC